MRIEKLVWKISIWYQMDGQKVQKSKLNIFDCTFGGVVQLLRRSFQLLRRSFQLLRHGIPRATRAWSFRRAPAGEPDKWNIVVSSSIAWIRLRDKGWLTEVLKRSVNHKSWLTGFRSFVRIPSTIPTGTSRLDIWIFGYLDYGKQFVAASPIRTSVWCSPAGGFFFQKKHVPGVFAA